MSHAFQEPAPAVFDTKCMYFFKKIVPFTVICLECKQNSPCVSLRVMLCHVNTNPSALLGLYCMYNLETQTAKVKVFLSATCR